MALFAADPLEIPEIRIMVGQYLGRPDLVRCLSVCRSWRDSFLPLVWSNISIAPHQPRPTVEAFMQHGQFIKDLAYHTLIWRDYGSTLCRNLSTLHVYCNEDSSRFVISRYDRLQNLSINGVLPCHYRHQHPIWKPPYSFQNLSSLVLCKVNIEPEDAAHFWDMCTRLESLIIQYTSIVRPQDDSTTLARLQSLRLSTRSDDSEQDLDIITRCPNLTSLHWEIWSQGIFHRTLGRSDLLAAQFANGAWPKLCELRLSNFIPTDAQLAQIISGMHQVKVLNIPECEIGPLSYTVLRLRFQSIRELLVGLTSTVVWPEAQEILASCQRLRIFRCRLTSQNILQGQPWACENSLTCLIIGVIIPHDQDADHHQRNVFEKISRLTNLELFVLDHTGPVTQGVFLKLLVGKGLEQLTTLKKLKTLGFYDITQELMETEIQWMIENWTSLQNIDGRLSQGNQRKPLEMLQAAGIQFGSWHCASVQ
ncbi:MAG: hypothetical protein J3Q66DRAFT_405064 [Benniella sp.]|nr:MAG: hypothetical protein J3Q66DRAFT_405064 [Benniella sp.]